jgi:hypothetical protein
MPENPCVGGSIPPGPTLEPHSFYEWGFFVVYRLAGMVICQENFTMIFDPSDGALAMS